MWWFFSWFFGHSEHPNQFSLYGFGSCLFSNQVLKACKAGKNNWNCSRVPEKPFQTAISLLGLPAYYLLASYRERRTTSTAWIPADECTIKGKCRVGLSCGLKMLNRTRGKQTVLLRLPCSSGNSAFNSSASSGTPLMQWLLLSRHPGVRHKVRADLMYLHEWPLFLLPIKAFHYFLF